MKAKEAGSILLDISGGMNGYMIKEHTEPGWFGSVGKMIRDNVNIPVLLTGGITDAEDAERILKDPDWSRKALAE